MIVLGIHASYNGMTHDPSACLLKNGEVIAAIEEERLNRIKTSSIYFPYYAIKECLKQGKVQIQEVDVVACDGITYGPMHDKLQRSMRDFFGYSPRIELVHHALSHTAGAFASSGFAEALVVSVDGMGDKVSSLVSLAKKSKDGVTYQELYRADRTVSLGNYYTAFTNYLGFRSIEGEYKVMGMAAYGQDRYDLSDLVYFNPQTGQIESKTGESFIDNENYTSIFEPSYKEDYFLQLTGVKRPVYSSQPFEQAHFDLAASVQAQFQRTYLGLIRYYLQKTGAKYLCLTGGCALNCLANKELLADGLEGIYVMPAASDRGLSMGSAMWVAQQNREEVIPPAHMYLGRGFSNEEIKKSLDLCNLEYQELENPFEDAAQALERGEVIAWFFGRAEFGPRALGHRSILANPRIPGMKDVLNAKIKFREAYRPFAPAILESDLASYYPSKIRFPYMTLTIDVPEALKPQLPEAVHFDGTARVQTVNTRESLSFHALLSAVKAQAGTGTVINTSFNLAGEPIVDSPQDAVRTFYSSGIDSLYLQNFKLKKKR